MSESVPAEPVPAVAADSPGTLLRRAREAAGLHVAHLAASLKVPVRKLEALEQDRWDELPDAVFVRALASSVCRALKIDPAPVLERLPQGAVPRLAPEHEAINAPFRAPGDPVAPNWFDNLTRPTVLAVGALLFGALVLVLMPSQQRTEPAPQPQAESTAVPMAAGVQGTTAPAEPAAPPALAASEAAVPVTTAPVAAPVPATPVTPAAPATAAPVPPAPAAAAAPTVAAPAAAAAAQPASAPAAAAGGLLVFRASAPSWIQVTDAAGTVVLRRELQAGESASAAGAAPLAVTVGNAGATTVLVRGQPRDLAPIARDNVARFEIK
jgi:cytoskeleton protein RodZ